MTTPPAAVTILFDGQCPLCLREVSFLAKRDRGRGRLGLIDITAHGFDATRWGLTLADVHGSIHGLDAEGRVITGPEVFRRAYEAVGLGWIVGWTAWRPFRGAVDAAYRWFARHRHRLTGRKNPCPAGSCGVAPTTRAGESR